MSVTTEKELRSMRAAGVVVRRVLEAVIILTRRETAQIP